MNKKFVSLLALLLIIIVVIIYGAYDFYKTISPESLCVSECDKDGCDNQTAFSCVKDINTCYYKQPKEIEIGLCGAECLTSDDCNESLRCIKNKCVEPKCGDGRCDKDLGENCKTCLEDCPLDTGEICCSGKIVEGKCCSDSNCFKEHEVCEDYQCVIGPYCGDKTCDKDKEEDCTTCRTDCRPAETEVCCSGVIETGECCKDSQCEEFQDCKQHKCVAAS